MNIDYFGFRKMPRSKVQKLMDIAKGMNEEKAKTMDGLLNQYKTS